MNIKNNANDIRDLSDYFNYVKDCKEDTAPDRMFEYGELTLIRELISRKILVEDQKYREDLETLLNRYIFKLINLGCL